MHNYAAEFIINKGSETRKTLVITITKLIALYNKVIMNTIIARIDGPFNEKLIQRVNTTCVVA